MTATQRWHTEVGPRRLVPIGGPGRPALGVSPLDHLMKQGQAAAASPSSYFPSSSASFYSPAMTTATAHADNDHPYERAYALSRATTIRRTANEHLASRSPADRSSQDLLSRNVFRSSVASDASFDTITGQSDRESILLNGSGTNLGRRDSVNTVRTAEFDADGRWGRAWASKADDEESLYGGSEWGSELGSQDRGMGHRDGRNDDDDDDDDDGNGDSDASYYNAKGRANVQAVDLDALRQLAAAKDWHGVTLSDVPQGVASRDQTSYSKGKPSLTSGLHLQPTNGRERIVSLTPSIHGIESNNQHRASMADTDGTPKHNQSQPWSYHSNDSISTIGADGAHVYVWPPTPQGSELAHEPYQSTAVRGSVAADAASMHEWEAVSDGGNEDEWSRSEHRQTLQKQLELTSAQQQQMSSPSPQPEWKNDRGPQPRRQASAETARSGPISVSDVLASRRPLSSGNLPSPFSDGRKAGHPTGRLPPPLPSPGAGYEDPNVALPPGSGIGRSRAAAIAAADGRESIVSDLDVETLHLDDSNRRDSTSTIGSTETGQMSLGGVRYDETVPRPRGYDQRLAMAASASPMRSLLTQDTPLAGPQPMSRAATTPGQGAIPPRPTLGSHPPPTPSSNPARPPLRHAATSSSMTTGTYSGQMAKTSSRTTIGQDTKTGPSVAENFLTQGIAYHEQGDMSRSAYYFERSAKVDGGCVVGMCMWGMTLREGWGARKDPRKGFEWIQRAAAKAGEMMQAANAKATHRVTTEAELKAIRSELKLSVYELGKCFCHGWGVKMDKRMALEYFELAAKLGDADAQAEAGALYAAGKGCKKDLKKAAKYYRMAAAQGYDLIGLSWVWKPKFDDE